jgi:uncharacterized membrane protein YfcA
MTFPLVLMSFGVGALIGLTGMGGAALMAPFLILAVGVQPITAVGTDLVYGAVAKMVGAWAHMRQGTVDLRMVGRLAAGSIPGGLIGAALTRFLMRHTHDAEQHVRKAIAALLVLVAVILLTRMFYPVPPSGPAPRFTQDRLIPLWGAVVGFCVGFTSVGSGSMLTPLLMICYPKRPATAVGTDVFHAAILVAATGLVYTGSSAVEWSLVPALLAGAIPGVLLGSKLAIRIPPRPLQFMLAVVLLVCAYRMF